MVNDYRWVLQLIDRCYGAALDEDHWAPVLKDIREFLDGCSATLFFTDLKLKPIDQFFGDNVSPDSIADYKAHFHTVDIRMQRAVPGAVNKIVADGDLVDESIINEHEFYQDFLRPIGHRYIVSSVMQLDQESYAFCSVHRGLQQDHAGDDVLDDARLLLPHLRRSLQLRRKLSTINVRSQAAFDLLDGLGQAVFLIAADGRIAWQNAWAHRLLRQQDGLLTSDGELRTLSAASNAELQRLIRAALTTVSRPRAQPGGMMTISRPSLKRSYQVLVTPLPRSPELRLAKQGLTTGPLAAIFILDLEQKSVPPTELLRRLYDLTPAEARLATALGSGLSLKAYAEKSRLSIHYVRWLLKQVESKTDTRRITDLIRLLARQTGFFGGNSENGKENDR